MVLNESILRRPVGGREVMAAQLDALAEAASLPNVSLRVVPFSAGRHHGMMTGPFEILRFPVNGDGQDSEPPTVYVDGFTGDLYLDKPAEVERYSRRLRGHLGRGAGRDHLRHPHPSKRERPTREQMMTERRPPWRKSTYSNGSSQLHRDRHPPRHRSRPRLQGPRRARGWPSRPRPGGRSPAASRTADPQRRAPRQSLS